MLHPDPESRPSLGRAGGSRQFRCPGNDLCALPGSGILTSLQRRTWSSRAAAWRQKALSGKGAVDGDNSGM